MSWQAYVDSSMVGSGHVDKGAIYSLAGDSKWAASSGFELSTAELKEVISGLQQKTDNLYASGLHVGGVKYFLTLATDRSLYGRAGKDGVVIVKTKQAILIGHYNERMIAGNSAKVIEDLADYLIKTGY